MSVAPRPSEGIYRRVTVRMYGDERFTRLSALQPSGQALWLYLLTGPHTGPIPGVFVAGRAALAETLGWDSEAFAKAFAEVLAEGLALFDEKTRLCFIPNAIRHNAPPNPNVVKSWRAHWLLLPECPMREQIRMHILAALTEVSEAFGKAFDDACGKTFGKASEMPLPKTSPKHMAKQEAGSRKQDIEDHPPKGTRLSPDWTPTVEDIAYADKHGVPWQIEAEKFVNHFSTMTGKGSVRKGWSPSWRTWCLKSLEFRPKGNGGAPQSDLGDMFRRGSQ